jgi:hypothetical protein
MQPGPVRIPPFGLQRLLQSCQRRQRWDVHGVGSRDLDGARRTERSWIFQLSVPGLHLVSVLTPSAAVWALLALALLALPVITGVLVARAISGSSRSVMARMIVALLLCMVVLLFTWGAKLGLVGG